ncbi:hypothetical protein Tco_1149374 [Tanacetum coccineum]
MARMYVRAQTPISLPLDTKVARLLAIPTPPPSLLSSLSSPLPQILSPLPHILSPPLPVSPPPLPASPTYPLGYRATMIWLRAETPSTFHPLPSSTPPSGTTPLLPIPLPTPSPPLLLPSIVCRAGVSEVTLPPQKRLCIALGLRYEVGKSSSAPTGRPTGGFRADYGFVGTLDDEIRQDTYEIYGRLDDAQDDRLLMSGQLNMLHRDRRAHARTARLMETEARLSCEAWVQSMDASDTTRSETQVTALQSQQGPASGSAQPEILEEAAHDVDKSRNGKDSHDSGTGVRRQAPPARECTYPDFMKCKPYSLRFATCTLLRSALTWWNSHVKTVGHDVAYAMTWTNLKKKMTDKYCPRDEVKKLESEMMFPEESDKIEKYVGGLPVMIHRSVMASKPKTMQDAIEFATELMDKKIRTFAKRQSKNKRKLDDNQQQQQNKRQTLAGHMLQGLVEFKRNLLDRVRLVCTSRSRYQSVLKADTRNLASHLPRACLMLAQEGIFPFFNVNSKAYHLDVLAIFT